MGLETRLHPYMPFRGDIVCTHKHVLDVIRNAVNPSEGAIPGNLIHQTLAVKSSLARNALEDFVYFHHRLFVLVLAFKDIAEKGQAEHGLNAARAAGDDADRAG